MYGMIQNKLHLEDIKKSGKSWQEIGKKMLWEDKRDRRIFVP
jgi:uncharacterized membrane protein